MFHALFVTLRPPLASPGFWNIQTKPSPNAQLVVLQTRSLNQSTVSAFERR